MSRIGLAFVESVLGFFVLLAAGPVSALTVTVGSLVQISAPDSPVPADAICLAGENGYLYRQSEVEPSVAIDPTNANRIIASYQQDRWNNGAAQEMSIATSSDGGLIWSQTVVPYQVCLGGMAQRISDPWVTVSPNGTMFQMGLYFFLNFANPASETGGMAVSRSTDHGATWSSPFILDSEPTPGFGNSYLHSYFHDKNSITADPDDSNFIYAVWDNAPYITGKQKTMFARSTDGGLTWEPAHMIYNPATDLNRSVAYTQSHVLRVLPNGTLVDLMIRYWPKKNGKQASLTFTNSDTNFDIAVIRSTDKGKTWSSKAIRVSTFLDALVFTQYGDFVRCGDMIPTMAVNSQNGNLYVAWQDTPSPYGQSHINLSVSRDGGSTWSSPITASHSGSSHAFTPAVSVTGSGLIALFYYDFRNNTGSTSDPVSTDAWLGAFSDTGSSLTFQAEVRLTNSSFEIRQAPYAGGYFLGDYEGLAAAGDDVSAVFVTTVGNWPSFATSLYNPNVFVSDVNQTDVFYRKVTLTP